MDPLARPPVVLDCGTGYLKAGIAGKRAPSLVTPSVVGYPTASRAGAGRQEAHDPLSDLDYVIGEEALKNPAYAVSYPMKHGLVVDWDSAEKLWTAAIYKHLQVMPQDQPFILTEPPLNPPESREALAEVFFETFDVPGLHIGIQAVLALYASHAVAESRATASQRNGSLTGVVVDSGDGCTHVIPVCDGFVLGSAIQSVPIAGRDITTYIQQLLRERGEPIPPEQSLEAARTIKEEHCYVCGSAEEEAHKYEERPGKHWRQYQGADARTGEAFTAAVGPERYLGPEVFFQPGLVSSQFTTPLPALIDSVVQSCPIDARRALYANITLSGGSTLFREFGRRVQRELKQAVGARTQGAANEVEVNVLGHPLQRYAVWLGGSMLGVSEGFKDVLISRQQYQEHGPSIVRGNAVYRDW